MSRSTKNLLVLVGTVTILSLALLAVGPVLAQSGSSGNGQASNGSNTVVVSTTDTLGTLVARYNLTGSNLRDFLSLNTSLPLVPGQTVVFPAGLSANIPTTGQSSSSSQGQATTSPTTAAPTTAATVAPTATTAAMVAPTATTAATVAPAATTAATTAPVATTASSSAAGSNSATQTYVTKPGDTLGTILGFIGFQASSSSGGAAASTATPMATTAATVAPTATTAATVAPAATTAATVAPAATTAATMAATTAAGGAASTGTPMATTAATTAAGGAVATTAATVAPTATTAATMAPTTAATVAPAATTAATAVATSSGSAAGGPSDAQIAQFVQANSGLRFGVVVTLPAGIPATGANSSSNGTGNNTTNNTTNNTNGAPAANSLSSMSGQAASNFACSTNAPKGFGYYKVKRTDTLQSISTNFGVPVETILQLNRGSAFAKGDIILLPSVEAPGMWDVNNMCPSNSGTSK